MPTIMNRLQVGLPKTVLVAELENAQRRLPVEIDDDFRCLTGFQATNNQSLFCDHVYPLDEMVFVHGMSDLAHLHSQLTVGELDNRNMLFGRGIGGVGIDDLHFLAAAHELAASVICLNNDVSALGAFVERSSLHSNHPFDNASETANRPETMILHTASFRAAPKLAKR